MRIAHLSEIEAIPVGDAGLVWKPIRQALGIESFGVNAYTATNPGDEVVEEHDELSGGAGRHEEVYVVVNGDALFTVAGQEIEAPAGTCLFLDDPAARRSAVAREPGTMVLAIGGTRGQPFRVSPWEFSFRGIHAAKTDRESGKAIIREGLSRYPENASLLYNLACIESLDGEASAAIDHLTAAIDLDGSLRAHAQSDADFDSIRREPGFPREDGR